MDANKKNILSCIQPTGDMHFGNYFGAVKNWVDLQEDYNAFYGVVDYHALTMPYNPQKLRKNTWDLIFNLLAVGVKPENLFIQSLIPEHTELCWIFNCFCSVGDLKKMPQFKEKSEESKKLAGGYVSAGLFDYPVLQAADILIYRAHYVPVGKDQEHHLDLCRDIAQRFNHRVGKEYFIMPETLFTESPKIRSTADPTRKMSKSAGEKHYIGVFEEENRLRKKIRSAVTDTGDSENGEMSPGVENLFTMLKAGNYIDEYHSLMKDYEGGSLQYAHLKDAVADGLVKLSRTFRERRNKLLANKKEVKNQIKYSSEQVRKIARQTLREVKELAGLMNIKVIQ